MKPRASAGDAAFCAAFERCEVPPGDFDHRAHVRLAYVYLCELPPDDAHRAMKNALLGFLAHLGVSPAKYHETITRAWILAVRHFMATTPACESAADFIGRNPVLLDQQAMLTHYSAEVLFSAEARRRFVEPDIDPIPRH